MKGNKLFIVIGTVIILLVVGIGAYFLFFNSSKDKEVEQKNEEIMPNVFELIDKAYEEGEINADEMVKQKFYAVFGDEKFNSKYSSEEIVLHPDLDILLEENADKITKGTAEEVLKYFAAPELESDLVIEKSGDDFNVIQGEIAREKNSLFPEAKASVLDKIKLNAVISAEHFNLFFQKTGEQSVSVDEVKDMARDLDYSMNKYLEWGYKKPKITFNPGSFWSPDVSKLLSGKIPVYVVKKGGEGTLGLAVSDPQFLKNIAIFLGPIMGDSSVSLELLANSIFPYINVYAGTIKDFSSQAGCDPRELFKVVMYHEVFHMAQNGIGRNTEKFWSEHTAQWATMQLMPDSSLLATRYLGRYFKNTNKPIDQQNSKTEYEVYPFAEIVSEKLGKNYIKSSLTKRDVFKNIGDTYSGSFSALLHEFAVRNYLLDYSKKAITGVGHKPAVTKEILVRESSNNYSLDNMVLTHATVNYLKANIPEDVSISSLDAKFEVSNPAFNDQLYVGVLGTKDGSSYSKIDSGPVNKTHTFTLNSPGYKSFVFAVSNGSYVSGGELNYKLTISSGEENDQEEIIVDSPQTRKAGSIDTVMVIDGSGSMYANAKLTDQKSISKFDAAASSVQKITQLIEKESKVQSFDNRVGLVSFAGNASILSELTSDYGKIKSAVYDKPSGSGGTNIGAGVEKGVAVLSKSNAPNKIMILLTDGQNNAGMSKEEIMSGPVVKAKKEGIVIYTIGFDVESKSSYYYEGVDSILLYNIAKNTQGKYYYAQRVTELASAFIDLYHSSTGDLVAKTKGNIKEGETKRVKFKIEPNSGSLRATLNWPGSKLEMSLIDPGGRKINLKSSRSEITQDSDFEDIIYRNPAPGEWQVDIMGVDVPEEELEFYLTASSQEREGVDKDYIIDWVQDRASYILIILGFFNVIMGLIVYWIYRNHKLKV